MANSTKVALLFAGILVFLQVSCAVCRPHTTPGTSFLVNVPATMTVNGFQEGEGGGGPAACDGQYHSDEEFIVSLSSEWFDGGARCGKLIRIQDSANLHISATVVDECGDCDGEVGASAHIWRNFNLDPSVGEVSISWSDVN
ncbi:putative ripening-related protein 7 [Lolium rigidum]|uniref:putative ripening-related protein 7 n=1 Tax=Lolium rigidum TaxID=89674 RepID=UPI001F5C6E2B|nr:putative ripening-related protein 7 [Lolium rigidum]